MTLENQSITPADIDTVTVSVGDMLDSASLTIAPVWPLRTFVAVNPYVGHAGQDVTSAQKRLAMTAGARRNMPRRFYRDLYQQGDILDRDIEEALRRCAPMMDAKWQASDSLDRVKQALWQGREEATIPLPTRADVASDMVRINWADLAVERISAFASAFFDQGQATAILISDRSSLWQAWRGYARHDRSLDIMKLKGARKALKSLPDDRNQAAEIMLSALAIDPAIRPLYLERLARTVGGWAAFARQSGWLEELDGAGVGAAISDLIVIRLVFDWLAQVCQPAKYGAQADMKWVAAKGAYRTALADLARDPADSERTLDEMLQETLEIATQRKLLARFQERQSVLVDLRPDVQAAFCIDVRSEIVRRVLEKVVPHSETIGFAGFFGLALDVQPLGADEAQAQCPVLLKPSHLATEVVMGDAEANHKRREKARFKRGFKRFKNSAVGSFAFVDMFGLFYGARLVSDALGLTAPTPLVDKFGLKGRDHVRPTMTFDTHATDRLADNERIDMAENILRGMSLTERFANRVLLVGHGSTSRNNPHAAGLDCGACGGHSGEVNARAAAALINDVTVRAGLVARGISIPEDTRFYGALHDTVSDEIEIFEDGPVSIAEAEALSVLRDRLDDVARQVRFQRAPLLHSQDGAFVDRSDRVKSRGKDWAQVRPEWGLAGCSSFIAAPRHRTQGHRLEGKAFLHSYDWRKDDNFAVLELIMTAPMVVASWINLQYYASTIDQDVFGAGNKTLHNVVGRMGVLEGHGGDLRTGLPIQSVHDGERYVHHPTRLNVVLEAPRKAIDAIIAKHDHVRDLLDNGWVHLFTMDESGRIGHAYDGEGRWRRVRGDHLQTGKERAA